MWRMVLWLVVGQSSGWQLDPRSVESWLGGAQKVLIAAPDGDGGSLSAAGPLERACAKSRRLHLVLGHGSLKDAGALSDEAIGLRAGALHLDAALVLHRVSPEGTRLRLTIVSSEGEVLHTIALEPGWPLSANLDAPVSLEPEPKPGVHLDWQGRSFAGGGGRLYLGTDFYRALDRPDLARRYVKVQVARGVLVGAGFLVAVAGSILTYFGFTYAPCLALTTNVPPACASRDLTGGLAGVSVVTLGAAAMLVGAFLDPHPISALLQQQLVHAHNEALEGR